MGHACWEAHTLVPSSGRGLGEGDGLVIVISPARRHGFWVRRGHWCWCQEFLSFLKVESRSKWTKQPDAKLKNSSNE